MNKLVPVGTFIFGCAVGVAGTYKYFENKFKTISEVEIESVKQAFKRNYVEEEPKEVKPVHSNVEKQDLKSTYINKAKEIIDKEGYANISKKKKPVVEEPKEAKELQPYVIPPDEFDMEDYALVSLSYYADGVLANEEDEVITDVDATLGEGALNHFGEYEEDSIYVRDDQKRIDYEILMDERTYTEVVESKPRRVSLED